MMQNDLRLARSLPEMLERMPRLTTDASREAGLAFVPRPTDVIITPYSKCGTTVMQQIVHSLRTGGDVDFDDISRVVPWIEPALDLGIDLDAEQRAEPRAFKSHLPADLVPRGARYIVVVRDPRHALVSMYRFFEGWFIEPGCIDLDEFGRSWLSNRRYHAHLSSWWPRRADQDVLMLAYESMVADPEAAIRRVAGWLDLDEEPRIRAALHEASLETMRANVDRYEDRLMRELAVRHRVSPPGSGSTKVTLGPSTVQPSAALLEELDAAWAETIGTTFGLASYAELRASLDADQSPRIVPPSTGITQPVR